MPSSHQLSGLTDRDAIADVLYRAALGIDINDQSLWDSAWVSREGASITFDSNVLDGNGVQNVFMDIGPLDTSHHVSNIRVSFHDNKDEATATALGLHQHYRAGEGLNIEKSQLLFAARRYNCEFVKADGDWKMSTWSFDTVWNMGSPDVMPFQHSIVRNRRCIPSRPNLNSGGNGSWSCWYGGVSTCSCEVVRILSFRPNIMPNCKFSQGRRVSLLQADCSDD